MDETLKREEFRRTVNINEGYQKVKQQNQKARSSVKEIQMNTLKQDKIQRLSLVLLEDPSFPTAE